jgi:hypothetical protein
MAVPTGQGVGRALRPPAPRVEHARPFFDEFWRFGLDKGTSIVFWPGNKGGWRGGGKSGRGRFCGARHTPRSPYLTHARARDMQVCRLLRRERQTGGGSSRGRCLQDVTGRAATARAAAVARLDECSRATTGGRRSERELSSEQRETEGYRPAPLLRCSTGPLFRAGHLDKRDAVPTGLEFLGRAGAYVPLFLSPNPPSYA